MMGDEVRYTMLLDADAVRNMERLRETYGLKSKAAAYELATRVLSWATDQLVAGYEVGRFKDETFQPLLMPQAPILTKWNREQ